MLITRQSLLTQKIHTLDVPVTQEQLARWQSGVNVQDVAPELTPAQREFLISGATEEEWLAFSQMCESFDD